MNVKKILMLVFSVMALTFGRGMRSDAAAASDEKILNQHWQKIRYYEQCFNCGHTLWEKILTVSVDDVHGAVRFYYSSLDEFQRVNVRHEKIFGKEYYARLKSILQTIHFRISKKYRGMTGSSSWDHGTKQILSLSSGGKEFSTYLGHFPESIMKYRITGDVSGLMKLLDELKEKSGT